MSSVSAIIPVYNGEATIAQALDSALGLAGECDLEVVVVDDGSTDSTLPILESYGDRIRFFRQDHLGVSAARNHAVRRSRGSYLAFLDADDLWLPGRLRTSVSALDSYPAVGLVFCRGEIVDINDGGSVGESGCEGAPSFEDMLEFRFSFQTPAVTMRRQIFDCSGGFDERLSIGEDVMLWLRARECCQFISIPERLVLVRKTWEPDPWSKYPLKSADKFIGLIRERYGRRAKTIVRSSYNEMAARLLVGALCQLNDGDPRRAARTLFELLRYRPSYLASYLLRPANWDKLVELRNIRRMSTMLIACWRPVRSQ